MKKLIFSLLMILPIIGLAQVGIGTIAPDSNSILDLSNTNNRGLVLPQPTGSMPSTPIGVVYFDPQTDKIMYRETGGYNALTSWRYKFNGSTSNNTYFNESGNVGIGTDSPQRKFHVKNNGESFAIEGTTSGFIGFYPKGFSNGRKAYIGPTSSANGNFTIKNESSNDDILLNTSGSGVINTNAKIYENGNIVMPAGAIVMWSGPISAIPTGWALCNGSGSYEAANGTSYSIPDLRGKFIVAYDNNASSSNSANIDYGGVGNTGGENEVELKLTEMPAHKHGGSTNSNGNHRHDIAVDAGSCSASNNAHNTSSGIVIDGNCSGTPTHNLPSSHVESTGSHSHTITTKIVGSSTTVEQDGDPHENRPEYYVLAFIIKKK